MTGGRPGVPPRPLVLVGALVLLAHLALLQSAPVTLGWRERIAGPHPATRPVTAQPVRLVTAPRARLEPEPVPTRVAARPARGPAPAAPAAFESASTTAPAAAAPLAPAPAPMQVQLPPSARRHYTVQGLHRGTPVSGRAELAWWQDGRRYEATLRIDAPPLVREQRSTGTLQAEGLAPERYAERTRSEEAAHFDREAGRILFSARSAPAPLRAGAQDRLSVLLQLGAVLAARQPAMRAGDTLVVQAATTREALEWQFTVQGVEFLTLSGGATDALKLSRVPRHAWEPLLELWFAPGVADGPVRLRLTPPNGDWLDMQWSGTDKG